MINTILDGVYTTCSTRSPPAARKVVEEMRALLDEGPYYGEPGAGKGLVDALRYEDQVYGELKERLKQGRD